MAFCVGVILFFVVFAAAAIIIKLTTGAVFNWGDHLRYPSVILAMACFSSPSDYLCSMFSALPYHRQSPVVHPPAAEWPVRSEWDFWRHC